MEHSPVDMMEVVQMLQALSATKMVPVVRVAWNDPVLVKRVLDAGATTVMFPFAERRRGGARRGGDALPAAGRARPVRHEPREPLRHRAELPGQRQPWA